MDSPNSSYLATAGLTRRIASLFYELLLLTAILLASGWLFLFVTRHLDLALHRPLLQLYSLIVTGTYFVYCWIHGGQTLPMKTWRIRLVDKNGAVLSIKSAICRFLLAVIGLALCGLAYAWAILDRDGQFLHDRIAGTRLVRC